MHLPRHIVELQLPENLQISDVVRPKNRFVALPVRPLRIASVGGPVRADQNCAEDTYRKQSRKGSHGALRYINERRASISFGCWRDMTLEVTVGKTENSKVHDSEISNPKFKNGRSEPFPSDFGF
jgi:hypothetical protein